jgi:hypothetical protein
LHDMDITKFTLLIMNITLWQQLGYSRGIPLSWSYRAWLKSLAILD